MKRLLVLLLAFALCFVLVSCGEAGESEAEQEGLSDEVYSETEYDFGLEMTDDFNLSGVLEKCEYVSLAEREDEFKTMLETGLSESGLDNYKVDDASLKELLEHAIEELKADGNEVTDEMVNAYNNMVFASANDGASDDDWDRAIIQIEIIPYVEDYDEESASSESPEDGKFQHVLDYVGRTYHDPEEPDCEKICADLQSLMGIKVDPSKLKEALAKAVDITEKEDRISELTQEITVEGDGFTDTAHIEVSAYIDDEVLHVWVEGAGRTRVYE